VIKRALISTTTSPDLKDRVIYLHLTFAVRRI